MSKKRFRKIQSKKVDENVISSISSPNVWTRDMEDAWLKQPSYDLKRRFPPMSKPRHVNYVIIG